MIFAKPLVERLTKPTKAADQTFCQLCQSSIRAYQSFRVLRPVTNRRMYG